MGVNPSYIYGNDSNLQLMRRFLSIMKILHLWCRYLSTRRISTIKVISTNMVISLINKLPYLSVTLMHGKDYYWWPTYMGRSLSVYKESISLKIQDWYCFLESRKQLWKVSWTLQDNLAGQHLYKDSTAGLLKIHGIKKKNHPKRTLEHKVMVIQSFRPQHEFYPRATTLSYQSNSTSIIIVSLIF